MMVLKNSIMEPIAKVWSVEFLPSNPAARVRCQGVLFSILGLGVFPYVCVLSCVVYGSVLSCVVYGSGSDILLTTDFREARPCVSVKCSGPETVAPPTGI